MKALAIVSSPRKGGNSELAAKEILSQLPASWEKEMIRLNELNIKLCSACYACIPEDKKCKLDDDLQFLLEHVKSADKIIITCPVYFFGTHTMIKVASDRLLSILNNYNDFANKDCVIASFYGREKWDGAAKENLIIFARQLHLNLVDMASLLATIPGESVEGENLKVMQRLAKSLVKPPAELLLPEGELRCTYCHGSAITPFVDGKWKCTICGETGTLEYKDGKFSIRGNNEKLSHFSVENKVKHGDFLTEKKNYFIENRVHVKELQAKYAEMDWWVKP